MQQLQARKVEHSGSRKYYLHTTLTGVLFSFISFLQSMLKKGEQISEQMLNDMSREILVPRLPLIRMGV